MMFSDSNTGTGLSSDMYPEVDGNENVDGEETHHLCEERATLEQRLLHLKRELNQVQKENSVLKMRSTITLGNMRLQLESIREDSQFLREKRFHLKNKIRASEQSFRSKEVELAHLQSMINES